MRTRIGSRRHLITIEKNTLVDDANGVKVDSWSTHITVWAAITASASKQENQGNTDIARALVSHQVNISFRSDITEKMRVRRGSRLFDIKGLVPDEDEEELVLHCEEVKA